ncbi:MAG: DUF4263 domain-containing protein [ANME-2 cluster archaeon]|jgi:hypothetical protein|nr:DUF4263 domain-containing protein [ANME-2 cluster archaeon]
MPLLRHYWGRKFIESDFYQPLDRFIAGSSSNKIWLYTVDRVNEFTRDNSPKAEIKPTGRTILRIVRWRARNDDKNKNIKYWRTGGRNGGSYNIRSLKEWSITSDIVNKLINTGFSDTNFVNLPEEEYDSLLKQKDEMENLHIQMDKIRSLKASKHAELKSYKKKIDVIRTNINNFKKSLSEFKSLVENEDTNETEVHKFIKTNKLFWLFGLEYVDMVSHVWFPPDTKDYQFDIMLQRHDNFWDLVELKGPNENLFKKKTQHRFQPNKQLSDAISQVFKYLYICDTNPLKDILKPKAIVVIGTKSKDKTGERRIFSSYLNNVDIITYTELIEQGNKLLEYVKGY